MKKPNLILVQAFPANRTISAGIIRYMEDYFNVYFVELPGFSPRTPRNGEVTLESLVRHVEDKIAELDLDSYVLGGISFGFYLINLVKVDERCLYILASQPFLGIEYTEVPKKIRWGCALLTTGCSRLGLEKQIWDRESFWKFIRGFYPGKNDYYFRALRYEVDPESFCKTSRLLVSLKNVGIGHKDLKHVIFLSDRDETVDSRGVERWFLDNVESDKLFIKYFSVEHFPKEPTYEYFKSVFRKEHAHFLLDMVMREEEIRGVYS